MKTLSLLLAFIFRSLQMIGIGLASFSLRAQEKIIADESWFPPEVVANVVSDNLNANGIRMKIWEIRSKQKSDDLTRFYANLWEQHQSRIRYKSQQWDVAGFIERNWVATVQLLPERLDSFGYLTISEYPLNKPSPSHEGDIQLPPESERTTDITAIDGPHHSRTTVFTNKQSLASNVGHFRANYLRAGWVEDETPQTEAAKVLLFRKSSEQLTVTMTKQGDTTEGVAVLVEQQ